MMHQVILNKYANVSATYKTEVKFEDGIEFIIEPLEKVEDGICNLFGITDVKGDFEITSISRLNGNCWEYAPYDKETKTFRYQIQYSLAFTFYINANITLKKVSTAVYHLQIPHIRHRYLSRYEFFESEFFLTDYNNLKFKYFVKKVPNKISSGDTEIHIENPHGAKINGKYGDYFQQISFTNEKLELSFVFDLPESNDDYSNSAKVIDETINEESQNENSIVPKSEEKLFAVKEINEIESQTPAAENSPVESKMSLKWYEIMSNNEFCDVTLISSDNIKIPSHRCILAKNSPIFKKIITESTELPVTINIENFDAETIQAALDFLYDKTDAINGKEMNVFKFACKSGYDIVEITDACCSFFEESVDPSNVCEYIQIAYENDFEELKKKCIKVLVEKKKEIDPSKFSDLPKYILSDFFNSL